MGFLLSAVIDSLYPEIVQSFRKDRLRYERKNRQLYAIVIYASLFVSAHDMPYCKALCCDSVREKYLAAVMPLRIVVWYTAFSYLGVARNAWMVCENQQKYLKYLYISAAALNVVLNLAPIPLWGASGAAAASDYAGIHHDPASGADPPTASERKTDAGCRSLARRTAGESKGTLTGAAAPLRRPHATGVSKK